MYQAVAVSDAATQFCIAYGLKRSASYKPTLYEESECAALMNEWRARMLYLFNISNTIPAYIQIATMRQHAELYVETAAFATVAKELPRAGS